MSWLSLLFAASLLIGSSLAEPSVDSTNEVHLPLNGDGAEGRACATCGPKGSGYDSHGTSTISHTGYGSTGGLAGSIDLSSILSKGTGMSIGFFAIPILAVNIAILVLLGILLAHVKSLGGYGDTGTGEVYHHYAPAPAPYSAAPSTYQSYDSGYHKRSAEEGRGLESPSTFQFLTNMVADAIEKYGELEREAEE